MNLELRPQVVTVMLGPAVRKGLTIFNWSLSTSGAGLAASRHISWLAKLYYGKILWHTSEACSGRLRRMVCTCKLHRSIYKLENGSILPVINLAKTSKMITTRNHGFLITFMIGYDTINNVAIRCNNMINNVVIICNNAEGSCRPHVIPQCALAS